MRAFTFVLQYVCIAFAIYLCYRVGSSLYLQDYVMMDIVANVGTILICINLAVFLWHSRSTQAISLKDYATRLEQPAPTFVKVCRKLGHFGIMLIITSWIVPIING